MHLLRRHALVLEEIVCISPFDKLDAILSDGLVKTLSTESVQGTDVRDALARKCNLITYSGPQVLMYEMDPRSLAIKDKDLVRTCRGNFSSSASKRKTAN